MRPRGEIRRAIGDAAWALTVERAMQGGTWRELAQRACVGYAAARQTVKDMARAGELQAVGAVRVDHSRRPMTLYAPAPERAAPTAAANLATVMRTWAR